MDDEEPDKNLEGIEMYIKKADNISKNMQNDPFLSKLFERPPDKPVEIDYTENAEN